MRIGFELIDNRINNFTAKMKVISKITVFLAEVKQELGKVSWSTRQEIMGATVVVISITAMLSVFIGLSDLVLSKILSVLFR